MTDSPIANGARGEVTLGLGVKGLAGETAAVAATSPAPLADGEARGSPGFRRLIPDL